MIDASFTVSCVSAHLIATPGGTTSGSQRCPTRRLVKVTRRKHLHQLGAALLAPCGTAAFSPLIAAQANAPAWRQGLSLFGDLKYPAKFPRFDYASSSAPTGGRVRQGALGSYDNFNLVTRRSQGKSGHRNRVDLRHAIASFHGRGCKRIRIARGSGRLSRRFFLGAISSAPRGKMA